MATADLYHSLTTDDIDAMVANQQEEHLHLDFKQVRDAGLTARDDRENLARAMSGFANSAGGLIVWGVDARKNANLIDCANRVVPIEQPALLVTRLNTLTGEATDPPAPGVLHRAIDYSNGHGVVLTLVPESDSGPHMAKLGVNAYYKRSGDRFYMMEHYDIADMFGKRQRPKLAVFYNVVGRGPHAQVNLGIRNDGRATALAPFLAFQNEGTLQRTDFGLDGNRNEGLPRLIVGSRGFRWAYGADMGFALHPGMSHEVAGLGLGIPARQPPNEDVVVKYAVACEGQPLQQGTLVIPIQELRPTGA